MPVYVGVGAGEWVIPPPAVVPGDAEIFFVQDGKLWAALADGTFEERSVIPTGKTVAHLASFETTNAVLMFVDDSGTITKRQSDDGGETFSETAFDEDAPTFSWSESVYWLLLTDGVWKSVDGASYSRIVDQTDATTMGIGPTHIYLGLTTGTDRLVAAPVSGGAPSAITGPTALPFFLGPVGDGLLVYDTSGGVGTAKKATGTSLSTPTGLPTVGVPGIGPTFFIAMAYDGGTALLTWVDDTDDSCAIYRSTDGGDTWTSVHTFTSAGPGSGGQNYPAPAYCAQTDGVWWCSAAFEGGEHGLWRSDDDGDTWTFESALADIPGLDADDPPVFVTSGARATGRTH